MAGSKESLLTEALIGAAAQTVQSTFHWTQTSLTAALELCESHSLAPRFPTWESMNTCRCSPAHPTDSGLTSKLKTLSPRVGRDWWWRILQAEPCWRLLMNFLKPPAGASTLLGSLAEATRIS